MKRTIAVLLTCAAFIVTSQAYAGAPAAPAAAPAADRAVAPPPAASPAPAQDPNMAASVDETAKIGEKAPDFTLTDTNGKKHNLHDYAGKVVVLEWTNHKCPFVGRHYNSGSMQALQRNAAAKGVIWLTIVSSAPGKEGYVTAAEANAIMKKVKSAETARLLDADGTVGKLYGATTTPDMYVIDKTGALVYKGAIDNMATTDARAAANASNYVGVVLADLDTGHEIEVHQTQPYGCAIKYAE